MSREKLKAEDIIKNPERVVDRINRLSEKLRRETTRKSILWSLMVTILVACNFADHGNLAKLLESVRQLAAVL